MPVTADSFLWEATGLHETGTSVVVTHPDAGGTTAGMTLVVLVDAGAFSAVPAGWEALGSFAYIKSNVGAGETSWTWTLISSGAAAWYFRETDDVALVDPFDGVTTSSATIASGATRTAGPTALNAGSSGLALAWMGATKAGTTDVSTWASWTDGFTERVDVAPASGVIGRQIAVAWNTYEGWSTYQSTATLTTTAATVSTRASILLLRSADASINAPLAFATGFEFGTHGGMGNNANGPLNAANGVAGTFGTNYLVQAGSARNGSYGLRIANSATAGSVALPTISRGAFAFGCNIRPVSGSGTPVAVRFAVVGGGSNDLHLVYDVATEKFGLQWVVPGTTEWQTGTTPLNTWAWVEVRAIRTSSVHHADWFVETGTGDGLQTSPGDLTGTAVATSNTPFLGSAAAAQTATFDFDDPVTSLFAGAYPLGPHVARLLVPETTGATVSGTSTNFQRFTANGTLANVTGTEGALLDDVPPTVSASSDGVVQVAVAASDYLNLPMTTYALASDEIIAGVRFVASEWGGTGTGTGTLGWRGYDGLTETVFQAASASYDADSLTAISATYPRWVSAMWSGAANGAWTQTRLDAAAIRMGFSTDATPDMGASAVYLEVATRKAVPFVAHRLTSDEDPEVNAALVTELIHPYNSGVRTFTVSNADPDRSVQFDYDLAGVPQTPVVVAPSDPPTDIVVGSDAYGDVTATSFQWV